MADVEAHLFACTTGTHNKYYFIIESPEGGCDCYYGRIEALGRGHFSNQYYYAVSASSKLEEKLRKWKRKGDDYELVFADIAPYKAHQDRAVVWARSGGKTSIPVHEPEPVEVTTGWFNNAK
jgi:hypothetical protein